MRSLIVLALVLCLAQFSLISEMQAQERHVDKNTALILPNIQHEGKQRHEYRDLPLEPPMEPYFKKIQFINQAPAKTLGERVDRLVHGIKIDIPPEYDHYGYEIRRYMKSVLTPEDLNDPDKVAQKIQEAKTAQVILDYWKKALNEEQKAIEKELDEGNVSSSLIITFRYNSGVIDQFIPDAYSWIDRNIAFLELLQETKGKYYVKYPFYDVKDKTLRERFDKLYKRREAGLRRIIQYSPFRAMIY